MGTVSKRQKRRKCPFESYRVFVLTVAIVALVGLGASKAFSTTHDTKATSGERVVLNGAAILVDADEASYVKYGAKDLSSYLTEITGELPNISSSPESAAKAATVIVIGEKMALAMNPQLGSTINRLGKQAYIIHTSGQPGRVVVIASGADSHGTNFAIATLMQRIRSANKTAYLEGQIDEETEPSFESRGMHLNGWPVSYPYAFRTWKEQDWKHFVDIAWVQRVNLLFIWPFMDIIPVPMSAEDENYLREVARIVDYAQKQRGMEVWIMQSANRIGTSDCGTSDPRYRAYWVLGKCQQDMDPSNPDQFAKIVKSFEALYSTVRNPDGFCFIDSDPGGWPNSPLSDQSKIFKAARSLLDRLSEKGRNTKLVDWMWLGWGYSDSPNGDPQKRQEFLVHTIQNFKANLPEPWELLAGVFPNEVNAGSAASLSASRLESTLGKTTYIPYGAIEDEPSFPSTNTGMEPVRKALDLAAQYPGVKGIIGNNEMMLLQFPRTFYFLKSAWNRDYETQTDESVYQSVGAQLYPERADVIARAFEVLTEEDSSKIAPTLKRLQKMANDGDTGRPGAMGRYLFPDSRIEATILARQVEIQMARDVLIEGLNGHPTPVQCERLVVDYLDKLLSWNRDTGWNRMVDIGIWKDPIYRSDAHFSEAMAELRHALAPGNSETDKVDQFFSRVAGKLISKYDRDSVMIGCINPMKKAVLDAR